MEFEKLKIPEREKEIRFYYHDEIVQVVKISNLVKMACDNGKVYIQHKRWSRNFECDMIRID